MAAKRKPTKPVRTNEIRRSLVELGRASRILTLEGHGDISLGHFSMRDPRGRGVWIKRSQIGLEEVFERDFLLIDFNGKILEGKGTSHVEWPIHTEILLARPDMNFVGHTHADYVTMVSCLKEELRPYSHAGIWLETIPPPKYMQTSELISTPEMGKDLAACLGHAEWMLIRNHGCCFVGRTAAELCVTGILLRRACQLHLALAQTGQETLWPDAGEVERKRRSLRSARVLENYWQYYNRKLDLAEKRR
ncbi:MAG: class II aldolase/adducin family protein [Candidatus Binataceae bacterium]